MISGSPASVNSVSTLSYYIFENTTTLPSTSNFVLDIIVTFETSINFIAIANLTFSPANVILVSVDFISTVNIIFVDSLSFDDSIIFIENNIVKFSPMETLLVIADRIKEFSITIGTGDFIVTGAQSGGFRTIDSVVNIGEYFPYCIQNTTSDEFEIGVGRYISSNTFSRTMVEVSSNNNNIVNFSVGTKDVFIDMPAFILGNINAFILIIR